MHNLLAMQTIKIYFLRIIKLFISFSEVQGHKHVYRTTKLRHLVVKNEIGGKKLQKHIDLMCGTDQKAKLEYMRKFDDVDEIKYASCPDRAECIKEIVNFEWRLESIKFDSNEGNLSSVKQLEKIIPGAHMHVYRLKTEGQQIYIGGLKKRKGTVSYSNDPFCSHRLGWSHRDFICGNRACFDERLVAERDNEMKDDNSEYHIKNVTDTEYYGCPEPSTCLKELDHFSTLNSIDVSRILSDDQMHIHTHVYKNLESPGVKILTGEPLKHHIEAMASTDINAVEKYLKDETLQHASETEYISCPETCIWHDDLKYYLYDWTSITCYRDISHRHKETMPYIFLKNHVHVYNQIDGSSTILTGKSLKRQLMARCRPNVTGVEYYSCPRDFLCMGELRQLLDSGLKSVKCDNDISCHIWPMMSYIQQRNVKLIMPGIHYHGYTCNLGQETFETQQVSRDSFQNVTEIEWYSCDRYPTCKTGPWPWSISTLNFNLICTEMSQLKRISVQNTPLGTLPDSIGGLEQLEQLIVSYCGLTEIPDTIGNLLSLKYLCLAGNCVKELPSSLRKLTQLEFMDLRECGFKVFPSAVAHLCEKTFIRMTDNPIQIISKEDIRKMMQHGKGLHVKQDLSDVPGSKGLTKKIGKLILTFQSPSSPPNEVLKSENLADWLNYFSPKTKQCSLKHTVVLGMTGAGKSSLMRSLAHGIAQTASKDDRTVVFDELVYTNTEKKIQLNITDFGGHEIYEVAYPIFLTSGNKICIVAVDLKHYASEQKEEQVIRWLEMATNYMKSGDVKIIATKVDLCSQSELEMNLKCLKKDIHRWKSDWLRFCEIVIDHKTSNTGQFADIDMEQTEKLYQLQTWITELDLEPITTSAKENVGLQDLAESVLQCMEDCKEVIQEGWFDTLQQLQGLKGKKRGIIRFDELQAMYYRHASSYDLPMDIDVEGADSDILSNDIVEKCKEFLQYMHNAGLILWFSNSKPLKDVIFHNREFFVSTLRNIFHHDMREILKYNPASQLILNHTEFTDHLNNFLDCGILTEPLLLHIWDESGHKGNKKLLSYVMELLQSLNLCFQMKNSEEHNSWRFPWFVRNTNSEEFLRNEWPPFMKDNEIALEFCYKFCHRLPLMIYEQLGVAIQRNIYPGDLRQDWKDVIFIRSNGVKMIIQRFLYEENPSIKVSLRTQLSNIQAMYELCLRVNVDIQMLLDTCPGVVYDSYLVCPHCLLTGAPRKKHWNLSLIENFARQDWITCSAVTPAVDFPSAMVYFMSLGK